MAYGYVMDYETMQNLFVAVFEDINTEQQNIFVIHKLRNDLTKFLEFLDGNIKKDERHVSFNGLAFDAQITEYFLKHADRLLEISADAIAREIYAEAQRIIEQRDEGVFADYNEWNMKIKQLDLFKMNHWDNAAKRSSLKWIQYSMNWHNIQDMPYPHTLEVNSIDIISEVVAYCINDVKSTKAILFLCRNQVNLRNKLSLEYKISLYSASEPKISKDLFLLFLSKKLKVPKYELKKYKTIRKSIEISKILLDYIQFEKPEFQRLHKKFKTLIIDPKNTKGAFEYQIMYRGVKTDFGFGGVHGSNKSGEYVSGNGMIIITSDVTSYYPNLAIRNKWSPAHIPKDIFCEQYEWFFDERRKIPKKDPKNYVYKIILNSTYGLSNEENSFLYDPEFTMRITMNGQLTLMMLYEMICEAIPEAIPIMQNTDGLETMIPESAYNKYMEVCKKWETITQLELEHDQYSKIFLGDVNNYIALNKEKECSKDELSNILAENPHFPYREQKNKFYYQPVKCKGRFEFHELPLHKNKSYLIIRKAIYNNLVFGTSVEQTINDCKDIFEFCAGVKIKGDWEFYQTCVINGKVSKEKIQNTLRYYVSNKGCKIIKFNYTDAREIQVESGPWLQTVFVKFENKKFEEYDINIKYYITKANQEINKLKESKFKQLKLF
jgi:hypothetical protein